jgi:hypothetical protein
MHAEKKGKRAEEFIATSWWLLDTYTLINTHTQMIFLEIITLLMFE